MKYLLTLTLCLLPMLGTLRAEEVQRVEKPRLGSSADEIKLGGVFGRRIMLTLDNNVHRLDIEKDWLSYYREKKPAGARAIQIGMLIEVAVRFAAFSGRTQDIELRDRLVTELLKTQEPNGYIGTFPPHQRVETKWDTADSAFILLGLLADHEFTGRTESRDAAARLGDWMIGSWTGKQMAINAVESAMIGLHRVTGNGKYLDFVEATFFPEHTFGKHWTAFLGKKGDRFELEARIHAYRYLRTALSQLELDEVRPNAQLTGASKAALAYIKAGGALVPGIVGYGETWSKTQFGRSAVDNPAAGLIDSENLAAKKANRKTGETCAQVYLIRSMRKLLEREGDAYYADVMERVIYNGLFAGQSADGRRIRYDMAMEGQRFYFDRDSYCCPNNYRIMISLLPGMVYRHKEDTIFVDLYNESSARMTLRAGTIVSIIQKTDYPYGEKIALDFGVAGSNRKAELTVKLRIPYWCADARLLVNGEPAGAELKPGSYATLRRTWQEGDRVELTLPMKWRWIKGRLEQEGRAALLRGPVVFCLDPLRNKLAGYHGDLVGESDQYAYWPTLAMETNDRFEESYRNIRNIRVAAESISSPTKDDAVRPGGMTCTVRAWSDGRQTGEPDLVLTLTEFSDPGGRMTYFLLSTPDIAVDDKLFGLRK